RHGQTGSILLHQTLPNAIVIPQRATFEILAKKYAYVVEPNAGGKAQSGVVHPREIVIQEEMDDLFVIKEGLEPSDKIIFEGQVRDGDQVEYEFRPLKDILKNLKFHAE